MDRLDLVKLFVRVAETGQVSEAARALGLSQPTASRYLKLLEEVLGTKLVDRLPQGISLTQAGRAFLAPARQFAEGWHEAVDAAKGEEASLSGTIRVAVPAAVGQTYLAEIAARFLQAHPDMAIEWQMRDDAVDVTTEGVDLWIHVGEIRREDLVVRHIYRIERAVVTSAEHTAVSHPQELRPMPAVRLSPYVPSTVPLSSDDSATFQLRQRVVFTTDNLFAARTAVLEGVGYAVLPLWCIHEQLAQGELVRACPAWRPPDTTFSLAYLPSRGRSPRVSALIDHVKMHLQGDQGIGIAFIQQMNAMESVTRLS